MSNVAGQAGAGSITDHRVARRCRHRTVIEQPMASLDQALAEPSNYSFARNDAVRARRTRLGRRYGENTTRDDGQRCRFETDRGSRGTPSCRVAVSLAATAEFQG